MKLLEEKGRCSPTVRKRASPTLRFVPKQPVGGGGLRQLLSPAAKEFLWSIQESRSYSPRTAIFRMGEQPEGVFLVESGEVSLWLERTGTYPLLLRTATAGEALGLSACVSGHPCEATAITVSHCEVSFVSTENLSRLVARFPDAWLAVAEFITSHLSGAYDHVSSMRSALAGPNRKGGAQCDIDHRAR